MSIEAGGSEHGKGPAHLPRVYTLELQVRTTAFTLIYTRNTEVSLLCEDREKMLVCKAIFSRAYNPQTEGCIHKHLNCHSVK